MKRGPAAPDRPVTQLCRRCARAFAWALESLSEWMLRRAFAIRGVANRLRGVDREDW
jgi:hypothetical protein